jgi:hypothetical protein
MNRWERIEPPRPLRPKFPDLEDQKILYSPQLGLA